MLVPKLFRNKEEQTEAFQNASGTKRTKQRRSKTFLKQRGTNQGGPKLFRSKEDQTGAFQNFQEQRGTQKIIPKLFRT